jgi:hypothetical protein
MSFLITAPNRVMPAELAERPRSTGRKSPTLSVRRGADRGRTGGCSRVWCASTTCMIYVPYLQNDLVILVRHPCAAAKSTAAQSLADLLLKTSAGRTSAGSPASAPADAWSERPHIMMIGKNDRAVGGYCRISTIGSALGGKRSQVVASLSEKRQMPPRPMSTSSA